MNSTIHVHACAFISKYLTHGYVNETSSAFHCRNATLNAECLHVQSVFSIIILDDIERLLEYVAIGPRFSNSVLQTLLVLLKKQPPKGRKLLVLGTTSAGAVMEDMEVSTTFNVVLNVPKLKEPEIMTVLKALRAFAPDEVSLHFTFVHLLICKEAQQLYASKLTSKPL